MPKAKGSRGKLRSCARGIGKGLFPQASARSLVTAKMKRKHRGMELLHSPEGLLLMLSSQYEEIDSKEVSTEQESVSSTLSSLNFDAL